MSERLKTPQLRRQAAASGDSRLYPAVAAADRWLLAQSVSAWGRDWAFAPQLVEAVTAGAGLAAYWYCAF